MPDEARRRYGDREVELILRRAVELEYLEPDSEDEGEDEAESGGEDDEVVEADYEIVDEEG